MSAADEHTQIENKPTSDDTTEDKMNISENIDSNNQEEGSKEGFKAPEHLGFKKPVFVSRNQRAKGNDSENQAEDKGKSNNSDDQGSKPESGGSEESKKTSIKSTKSPAQQLVEKSVPLPYKEPRWSGLPRGEYSLEVLKTGTIVDTVQLARPFSVVGRLAQCHIVMEHPSISRFHCVLQYRAESSEKAEEGWYAYDLGSTHGSFHNKHQMKPHTYYRVRVGHMLKFGGSTRMMILQGPDEDQEPEMEESVTELKAKAAERMKKLEKLESGELEEEDRERRKEEAGKTGQEESGGIDWGMGDDAVDEEDDEAIGENPFAALNEELYLDDPKKTLRGWFEREGYDLPNYETEDVSQGVYKCKVELPVPGPGGGPLVAVVEHRGRKKDAVVQCALEACRMLDRQGLLRQAKHESHERRRRDWAENDYYDSDEDNFLDRTGDVERKRTKRMEGGAETYDSLLRKYTAVADELSALEDKLAEADRLSDAAAQSDEDDLDDFMHRLKAQVPDKHKRVTWKLRCVELRKEELRLRRLTNVARPLGVPEIKPRHARHGERAGLARACGGRLGRKETLIRSAAFTTKTTPKEPTYKVHKAFLEEEPERKLKLKRLDEPDDEPPRPPPPKKRAVKRPETQVKHVDEAKRTEAAESRKVSKRDSVMQSSEPERSEVGESLAPPQPIREFSCEASGRDAKLEADESTSEAVSKNIPVTKDKSDLFVEEDGSGAATEGKHQTQTGNLDRPGKTSTDEFISAGKLQAQAGDFVPASKKSMEDFVSAGKLQAQAGDFVPASKKSMEDFVSAGKMEGNMAASSKKRVMGPSLPPTLDALRAPRQEKSKKKQKKAAIRYDEDDPNYDTWVPPSHQSGDGRTSLNDKLGY